MCVGVCVSASCVLCGDIVSDVTYGYVVFACINDNVGEGFVAAFMEEKVWMLQLSRFC